MLRPFVDPSTEATHFDTASLLFGDLRLIHQLIPANAPPLYPEMES